MNGIEFSPEQGCHLDPPAMAIRAQPLFSFAQLLMELCLRLGLNEPERSVERRLPGHRLIGAQGHFPVLTLRRFMLRGLHGGRPYPRLARVGDTDNCSK
jgi:hypothetical protein